MDLEYDVIGREPGSSELILESTLSAPSSASEASVAIDMVDVILELLTKSFSESVRLIMVDVDRDKESETRVASRRSSSASCS